MIMEWLRSFYCQEVILLISVLFQLLLEFKIRDARIYGMRYYMRFIFLNLIITCIMGEQYSLLKKVGFLFAYAMLVGYLIMDTLWPSDPNSRAVQIIKQKQEELRSKYPQSIPISLTILKAMAWGDRFFPSIVMILSLFVIIRLIVMLHKGLLC